MRNPIFQDKNKVDIHKGEVIEYNLGQKKGKGVVSKMVKQGGEWFVLVYNNSFPTRTLKLYPQECTFCYDDRLVPCGMDFHELLNWLDDLNFNNMGD